MLSLLLWNNLSHLLVLAVYIFCPMFVFYFLTVILLLPNWWINMFISCRPLPGTETDSLVVGWWVYIQHSVKSYCTVIRCDSTCQWSSIITSRCRELWQRSVLLPWEGFSFLDQPIFLSLRFQFIFYSFLMDKISYHSVFPRNFNVYVTRFYVVGLVVFAFFF